MAFGGAQTLRFILDINDNDVVSQEFVKMVEAAEFVDWHDPFDDRTIEEKLELDNRFGIILQNDVRHFVSKYLDKIELEILVDDDKSEIPIQETEINFPAESIEEG